MCMYVYVCVCMCIHVYACVYMCMHVYVRLYNVYGYMHSLHGVNACMCEFTQLLATEVINRLEINKESG